MKILYIYIFTDPSNTSLDTNWITTSPPPYEALDDLMNQQKKLSQEIEMEECSNNNANKNSTSRENVNNTRRVSARDRIRNLLTRTISRNNNAEEMREATLPTAPPYTISSQQLQNPTTESLNSTQQDSVADSSFGGIQPPYRTTPSYPVMFPPPFLANQFRNNNDVDEWSRVDSRRTSISTLSRPHTAGVRHSISHIPGELVETQRQQPEEAVRRQSCRSAAPTRSDGSSNSESISDNSSNTLSQDKSSSSTLSLHSTSQSSQILNESFTSVPPTLSITLASDSPRSQPIIQALPVVAGSISRPMSSTAVLTPGHSAHQDLNLPGIMQEQANSSNQNLNIFPPIAGQIQTISGEVSNNEVNVASKSSDSLK